MEFNEKYSIYLQIADYVNDHVLLGEWKTDDKIPSVRELAATLQVNPNTVMRAYDFLQQQGILNNKRGLGNYITEDAISRIRDFRRAQFMTNGLPPMFRSIYLLGIRFEELEPLYKRYIKEHFPKKTERR